MSHNFLTFEEFLLEAYGRDYGFSRSFDNEDMSPAGQQRRRAQEERDARDARARQLANPYQAAPAAKTLQRALPPQKTVGTNTVLNTAGNKGFVTFAFAELLGPVKRALENLTAAQRDKAVLGTADFKQGMSLYYNALNAPSCRETDKGSYHRDAKECRNLDDLYVLVSMYIEDYFDNTNREGDASAFVPKRRAPMESEDERSERTRQSWF